MSLFICQLLVFWLKIKIHVLAFAYIISTQSFILKSCGSFVHCLRAVRLYLPPLDIHTLACPATTTVLDVIKLTSLGCRWVFRLASAIAAVKAKLGPRRAAVAFIVTFEYW